LRKLLDFKNKEQDKLKMEKNEVQIDNYRTKQREDDLKRSFHELKDHSTNL